MSKVELFSRNFFRQLGRSLGYWAVMGPFLLIVLSTIDERQMLMDATRFVINTIKGLT